MKKLLNFLLIVASLLGYLEWGGGNSSFLYQAEYDMLFGRAATRDAFMHPFVFVPLTGQLLLLITLFQKHPGRILTFTGLTCLGILLVFLFFIGLLGMNWKIALSAVPFILVGVLVVRAHRKHNAYKWNE